MCGGTVSAHHQRILITWQLKKDVWLFPPAPGSITMKVIIHQKALCIFFTNEEKAITPYLGWLSIFHHHSWFKLQVHTCFYTCMLNIFDISFCKNTNNKANMLFSITEHMHDFSWSNPKGSSYFEMCKTLILFLNQLVIFSEGTELLTSESHIPIVSAVYEFHFNIIHVFGNSL